MNRGNGFIAGIFIGVAVGFALKNVAIGIGVGVALALAFSASAKRTPTDDA